MNERRAVAASTGSAASMRRTLELDTLHSKGTTLHMNLTSKTASNRIEQGRSARAHLAEIAKDTGNKKKVVEKRVA